MKRCAFAVSVSAAMLVHTFDIGILEAKARQPVALAPATPWHLDRDQHRCSLTRSFGDPANPFLLRFERFAPGDSFELLLSGQELKGIIRTGGLHIAYGEGRFVRIPENAITGRNSKNLLSLLMTSSLAPKAFTPGVQPDDMPAVTPDQEQSVASVSLKWGAQTLRLETGSLGKPFAALRTCTDNLVRSWGFDPAQQSHLRTRPILSRGMIRNFQSSYPTKLMWPGGQAWARLRVLVDADGRPHDCLIQRVSNGQDLGDFACDLMLDQVSFTPATDEQGNKVASYFTTRVAWQTN
ncbi:hypothetical protein WBP07_16120 [Novosphingobium sp. BL-8A]|uniref:hypothetical protein n=1 Tax=Novosphingobium sp. BL-8A TaxID=3127639 RepID=UPI003756BE52